MMKLLVISLVSVGISVSLSVPLAHGSQKAKGAAKPSATSGATSVPQLLASSGEPSADVGEDWKGESPGRDVVLSAMTGLAVIDSSAGLAVLGSASKKIVHHGFVPDINNQVFIEVQAGPAFFSGGTAFVYSTHLRWDFHKDREFSPYALGGLAGNITGSGMGDHWQFFPRFAVGAFWRVHPSVILRGEASHEFVVAGVAFEFQ